MSAQRALLSDARWHFQHGPMDIVIGAEGEDAAVAAAHEAAWDRFAGILEELVAELPALRERVAGPCPTRGSVASRMWQACRPYRAQFITPLAAVAGAVAQELIGHYARAGVERAWVNNGGDVALHLAHGHSLQVGLYADLARFDAREVIDGPVCDGAFEIAAASPVRGIATSGWRGRSFSLGIADSVTVLARSAAEADAAATVIANAVDADDARILRLPAHQIRDDSDLGNLPVTVDVPVLPVETVEKALSAGRIKARECLARGLIVAAVLTCQSRVVVIDAQTRAAGALPYPPPGGGRFVESFGGLRT